MHTDSRSLSSFINGSPTINLKTFTIQKNYLFTKGHGMVPLNGTLGRLLCKFATILSLCLLFLWNVSQRNQSVSEFEQLEGRFRLAQDQLSSLHAQIDLITRHKEKIEGLLEEEREKFAQIGKDQSSRISRLELENIRLGNALSKFKEIFKTKNNSSDNAVGKIEQQNPQQQPENMIVEKHAVIAAPKLEELEQKEEDPLADERNAEKAHRRKSEKEDVGAEKDYVFERPKPRDDLVFHRQSNGTGPSELLSGRELMRKLVEKKRQREKEAEEKGEEELGIVKAAEK